jgi:hypothetical protein
MLRKKLSSVLTAEQKIVVEAQGHKMDFVVGDFVTGLTATGMDETVAVQYVASILIQAGVGLLRDFDIASDDDLRTYVLEIFSQPRATPAELDHEITAVISKRSPH